MTSTAGKVSLQSFKEGFSFHDKYPYVTFVRARLWLTLMSSDHYLQGTSPQLSISTDMIMKAICLHSLQAAIAWAAGELFSVEDVEVAPPRAHEVRIQILNTGVCHTGMYARSSNLNLI